MIPRICACMCVKYKLFERRLLLFQGYIVDTLKFCGDKNQQEGIAEGSQCPSFDSSDDCPMSAERAFWTLASREVGVSNDTTKTSKLNIRVQNIHGPA